MKRSKVAHCLPGWMVGGTAVLLLAGSLAIPVSRVQAGAGAQFYKQFNLVSDIRHLAIRTDRNLVNPWGIAFSPTGPFWIADNGTGVSTVYGPHGKPFPKRSPLVVTIPPPPGSTETGNPTGMVFNGTSDFVVTNGNSSGSSLFIFASENGTISGWNRQVDPAKAIVAVNNSASEAIYKGLALGSNLSGNFLFATNFHTGMVDMFNSQFIPVGSFTDPNLLPALFAPFGIRNIGGKLYVTYAKKETADSDDDEPGPGNGFVDVFDTTGTLIGRFASQGTLNSPWGLALAPDDFGPFSKDLLIGNFGDGRINAFDPASGNFLGQLQDKTGSPISIEGLWALTFGNDGLAGRSHTLFFTAGIDHEDHGLFGRIKAIHQEDREGDDDDAD